MFVLIFDTMEPPKPIDYEAEYWRLAVFVTAASICAKNKQINEAIRQVDIADSAVKLLRVRETTVAMVNTAPTKPDHEPPE